MEMEQNAVEWNTICVLAGFYCKQWNAVKKRKMHRMKRENAKVEQSGMEHKMYTCRIEQWNDIKKKRKERNQT